MKISTFQACIASTILCALVACGGGGSSPLAPRTKPTAPSGGPPPPTLSVAKVDASLTSVQTMYAALPHTSVSSDLAKLAAEMVSSGTFSAATVTPGGITATLPDGSPALIFADHLSDPGITSARAAQAALAARSRLTMPRAAVTFPSTTDAIAILVNSSDGSGAFAPANQRAFAGAVSAAGFNQPPYAVEYGDAQLDTIVAVGASGPLDYFDLATHGMVAVDSHSNDFYAWLSDTPITVSTLASYIRDYAAGRVLYGMSLESGGTLASPNFAFTPAFVTQHVTFNPGAIFVNESCFGQNYHILADLNTLQSAGVGRYLGWDEPVSGAAADETDAFIFDRLIGEQNAALGAFVTQRSPAQRPFPFDDIEGALGRETRSGALGTSSLTYAQSPAFAGYPSANLVISDFGGESVQHPVIEYGLPSISYLAVAETPTAGSLTIYGHFPVTPGVVAILDPSQTSAKVITPTSWATDEIVAPIPATGTNSKGAVVVISATGIQSNSVNLTQWSGQIVTTENVDIPELSGNAGSGSGAVVATYNIDFRADVHPTVPSIDASPVPQNLTFAAPEGDSSAQVTSLTGTFATSDGAYDATFGLNAAAPALSVSAPPLAPGTFDVGALRGQPASCNNSLPGPQSGPVDVFCAGIGYNEPNAGTCSDDGGSLCASALFSAKAIFGAPTIANDGLLIFTMDPASYAITISDAAASGSVNEFEDFALPATGDATGSINAPVSAPQAGQFPANVRRAVLAAFDLRRKGQPVP